MPLPKSTTWLEYIEDRRSQDSDPEFLFIEGMEAMLGLGLSKEIHPILQHSIPSIYLLDYTNGKYTMFSGNVLTTIGYSKDYFEQGGVDFTVGQYHKDDLRLYNEQIFPDRLKFLDDIPPDEHHKYVFSYNFRFKKKDGQYSSILQRNSFIRSDANGKPLLSMGMVINVDHYKNPNTSVQLIEKITGSDYTAGAETVLKKTYFLNEKDCTLTSRELEFLKYLSDGLSSKQIAEKIYLSEHTVKVHRKNMLLKTRTSNVAELMAWAIKKEII
jgi:DNA-binding CsgD family transcriptional regulator